MSAIKIGADRGVASDDGERVASDDGDGEASDDGEDGLATDGEDTLYNMYVPCAPKVLLAGML